MANYEDTAFDDTNATSEPAPPPARYACQRISMSQYERQRKEYTEKKLKQLVEDMKKNGKY